MSPIASTTNQSSEPQQSAFALTVPKTRVSKGLSIRVLFTTSTQHQKTMENDTQIEKIELSFVQSPSAGWPAPEFLEGGSTDSYFFQVESALLKGANARSPRGVHSGFGYALGL